MGGDINLELLFSSQRQRMQCLASKPVDDLREALSLESER